MSQLVEALHGAVYIEENPVYMDTTRPANGKDGKDLNSIWSRHTSSARYISQYVRLHTLIKCFGVPIETKLNVNDDEHTF